MESRKYLREVFPRLFDELTEWARKEGEETLLHHAEHMFVTGRCSCGRCSDFYVDSDLPELSRERGSEKALRPVYYDVPGVFVMLGITTNEDGSYNLVSFETAGYDYRDGYLNTRLEAHGWPRPDPDDGL